MFRQRTSKQRLHLEPLEDRACLSDLGVAPAPPTIDPGQWLWELSQQRVPGSNAEAAISHGIKVKATDRSGGVSPLVASALTEPPAASASTLIGLTTTDRLVFFDSATPAPAAVNPGRWRWQFTVHTMTYNDAEAAASETISTAEGPYRGLAFRPQWYFK